jgi:hypothetical protein
MINRKRILIQQYNAPCHRAVPTQLKPQEMELKFYHILPIAPTLLLWIMDCAERCSIFFEGNKLKKNKD